MKGKQQAMSRQGVGKTKATLAKTEPKRVGVRVGGRDGWDRGPRQVKMETTVLEQQ